MTVEWYIWGLLAGLMVPWMTTGRLLREGFRTSFEAGLGAWCGASFIAVPMMEAIMLGLHLMAGE